MSRHQNYQQTHFLIEDESNSTHNCCSMCLQYEEDINILQEKLMETHNKLIQQIDECRDLEIRLSKSAKQKKGKDRQNNGGTMNGMERKSSVKALKQRGQNYGGSIEDIVEARTELLRNDLEAMRSKVLSQIVKSNKLRQQNKGIESHYLKIIQELNEKLERSQQNRSQLSQQNSRIKISNDSKSKGSRIQSKIVSNCSCGYQQKYNDLDKAYKNQRIVTNQLLQQNARLQYSMQDDRSLKGKSQSKCLTTGELRTEPKKKREINKQNQRQEFLATKNLIKQLQEAQFQIRSKSVTGSVLNLDFAQ